jgi:hypothetical protein
VALLLYIMKMEVQVVETQKTRTALHPSINRNPLLADGFFK